MAGYLGDDRCVTSYPVILVSIIGLLAGVWFILMGVVMNGTASLLAFALGILLLLMMFGLNNILRRRKTSKQVRIPVDSLILRSIEVIRSIPSFFLLFALLGMLQTPRMIFVILLIAFLYAPTVIRFVRAEAMKLRNQTYVQSAVVLGLTDMQIVSRHIIPNAIGPVLIAIAFGIGSAVLVEAGLSFLGIGIAPETISWGKMLNLARNDFSAWWMALLPGFAIFLTIAIFNRLGDVFERHLTGR
jgi:peptide/nickel transport system permease protein